jgi:tripartite-type tricarboxylate transporter receptor subunit TctC
MKSSSNASVSPKTSWKPSSGEVRYKSQGVGASIEETMKSWRGLALSTAILACVASPAVAQDYPSKPIRILVGFAAGGGTDILAREVAAYLQKAWGKPVVVENRPGANGNIATTEMARSTPDGHTLLVTVPSLITNAFLDPNFRYKPLEDFAPVTVIGKAAYVITVTPSFPAKDLRALITMAKEKPGSINYGTAGVGSSPHLTTELFDAAAGISMTPIPYRGASQVVTDVMSGQIPLSFFTTVQVLPLLKDGRLRGLAVTSPQRSKFVPDLPTVMEAGVPGYQSDAWWGMFAPGGTPKPIIAKLQQEISRILDTPEMKERLIVLGSEPGGNTPEQFAEAMKREYAEWEALFKKVKIKLE